MAFLHKNGLRQKKESLRRAGRSKTDGIVTITVCILALAIMTAGCGKVEEPTPVDLSEGNLEEMQDDGAGDADVGSDADESAEGDSADYSENNRAQEDAKDGSNPENQTEAGTKDDGAAAQDAQQTSAVGADLEGDVLSVNQDSFVVSQIETWTEGDASYAASAAPGYEEEEKRITVHVAGNCVYQYQTVKNGGINPEDVSTREGSFSDLQEGILVDMKGSWQDDGSFLADSVVMSVFV